MNVSLTPELEKLVAEKVASGMYGSASEVIREGLRLLVERDDHNLRRLEQLKKEIAIGLEQLDRGESLPFAKVIEDIKRKGRKRRAEERPECECRDVSQTG